MRQRSVSASRRDVEPYRLVNWGRRWYLVAYDPERADWRNFRVDRIELKRTPLVARFTPRELPDEDVGAYVARNVSSAPWRYRARVTVYAPAEVVTERLPAAVGPVTAIDEHTCTVETGSDNVKMLAVWLGAIGHDFTVHDAPELAEQFRGTRRALPARGGLTRQDD